MLEQNRKKINPFYIVSFIVVLAFILIYIFVFSTASERMSLFGKNWDIEQVIHNKYGKSTTFKIEKEYSHGDNYPFVAQTDCVQHFLDGNSGYKDNDNGGEYYCIINSVSVFEQQLQKISVEVNCLCGYR